MLRLQLPLPERYTDATDEELASRIAAAKHTLGERLFILGHHYQRDEIIQFADARSSNWYEPGVSGIVPAGGRCTTRYGYGERPTPTARPAPCSA